MHNGTEIKELRQKERIRQREIAKQLGVSQQCIDKTEKREQIPNVRFREILNAIEQIKNQKQTA